MKHTEITEENRSEKEKSKRKKVVLIVVSSVTAFIAVCVTVCILCFAGVIAFAFDSFNYFSETKIFSDISDFEKLLPYTVSMIDDKCTENLDISYGFACIAEWEGNRYSVYAYEFADAENAREYLSRMRMSVSEDDTERWSGSGGMFSHTERFYYHNKVLIVKSVSQKKTYYFIQWLQEDFDIEW